MSPEHNGNGYSPPPDYYVFDEHELTDEEWRSLYSMIDAQLSLDGEEGLAELEEVMAYYQAQYDAATDEERRSMRDMLMRNLGNPPVAFRSLSNGRGGVRDERQVVLVPRIKQGSQARGNGTYVQVASADHTDQHFDLAAYHGLEGVAPPEDRVRLLRKILGLE